MPLAKPATQAQEKAFTTSEGSVTESGLGGLYQRRLELHLQLAPISRASWGQQGRVQSSLIHLGCGLWISELRKLQLQLPKYCSFVPVPVLW